MSTIGAADLSRPDDVITETIDVDCKWLFYNLRHAHRMGVTKKAKNSIPLMQVLKCQP
jgi:hypothetical protein